MTETTSDIISKYDHKAKRQLPRIKKQNFVGIQAAPFINEPRETLEGFLVVDCIIAKTGVLPYVYVNEDGEEVVQNELIDESIFDPAFMESCNGAPFVLDHPEDFVLPETFTELTKGILIDPRSDKESGRLLGTLKIGDRDTIQLVKNKQLSEVSIGYICRLIPEEGEFNGEKFSARQTDMILNHLALVDEGRAGKDVRILMNSKKSTQYKGENKKEVLKMEEEEKEKANNPEQLKDESQVPFMNAEGMKGFLEQMGPMINFMNSMKEMFGGAGQFENTGMFPKKPEENQAADKADDLPVLNSANHVRQNTRQIVLEQIQDIKETYARANAFGVDVDSFVSKENDLNELRKHCLVYAGFHTEDSASKLNGLQLKAEFDVASRIQKENIMQPRENENNQVSKGRILSFGDLGRAV